MSPPRYRDAPVLYCATELIVAILFCPKSGRSIGGSRHLQKDEGVDVFIKIAVAMGIIALAWVVVAATFLYGSRELSILPSWTDRQVTTIGR